MKKNQFHEKILIQYTLASLILTVVLASVLSWLTSIQLKEQLILTHGDFYGAYVDSIEKNYSEIIPLIKPELEKQVNEKIHQGHSDEDHLTGESDEWSHFETDLIQFPFVKHFRILDLKGNVVREKMIAHEEDLSSLLSTEKTEFGKRDFRIMDFDTYLAITYLTPIVYEGEVIGTAELIDIDPRFKRTIYETQKKSIIQIALGGLAFYLFLFLLYYRISRIQAITINQLEKSQSLTIFTMSKLAELRDDNTGAHLTRTSKYCKSLGEELSKSKQYSQYLSLEYLNDLERSAPLHDIGKVGIPDGILQKPGPLTKEEFDVIKTHPLLGAKILHEATESLGFRSFFEISYQIVMYHHENWDGTGYPEGLIGEKIPLSARIMAVADVYDALTTSRPYKSVFSHEKAISIITSESGKKFDPFIVEALLRVSQGFSKIAQEFSDSSSA